MFENTRAFSGFAVDEFVGQFDREPDREYRKRRPSASSETHTGMVRREHQPVTGGSRSARPRAGRTSPRRWPPP